MTNQFDRNCEELSSIFHSELSPEERYKKIISLGEMLPSFPDKLKTEENRVPGCQSMMFIDCSVHNDMVSLKAWSDALISKGLAAVIIKALQGLSPQEVLVADLSFFQEIGLIASLSPSRVNGFASLITKIKQKLLGL